MSEADSSPLEIIRLKQANHSQRLEHGDRRMCNLELDLKALQNAQARARGIDWKLWLTVIGMVAGALVFGWSVIDRDTEDKLVGIRKDVAATAEDVAEIQTALKTGQWDQRDHDAYARLIDYKITQLHTELEELRTQRSNVN